MHGITIVVPLRSKCKTACEVCRLHRALLGRSEVAYMKEPEIWGTGFKSSGLVSCFDGLETDSRYCASLLDGEQKRSVRAIDNHVG